MKTCMIVDDSTVIRKAAKRILGSQTLGITEAETGQQALERCREEKPDYIILDHSLPDMDCIDFIVALKKDAGAKMPIIVLLMIELDIVPIMRAKRAGAKGHILKPFNRQQLIEAFGQFCPEVQAYEVT